MNELPPFPTLGIKLLYLKLFLDRYNSNDELVGLTTIDVCEKIVKPLTSTSEFSVCDLLVSQKDQNVGKATVFISHAWKYLFLDVAEAILFHFKESNDVIIWFDLFSNNQHKAVSLPFEWWRDTFKSAIQMIGKTVMILTPWDQPIPLTRAWCVWELFCTVDTNSVLEIALTRDQKIKFGEDLRKEVSKLQAFDIKSENSIAFKAEDKERIHTAIRNTVGFSALNSMISTALYGWMMEAAKDVGNTNFFDFGKKVVHETLLKEVHEKNSEGYVFQQMFLACEELEAKCFSSAEQRLIECEKIYEQYGNDWNHQEKVPMFRMLGLCYEGLGNLDKAEHYFHKRCKTYLQAFGESHQEYGKALNGIGAFYMRNQYYPQAITYFQKCIENGNIFHRQATVLAGMNNLGYCYKQQDDFIRAETIMIETLQQSIIYDNTYFISW